MEDIILFLLMQAIEAAVQGAIDAGIHYFIDKVYDESGKFTTRILYTIDTNGDGVGDEEHVLYNFTSSLPAFDSSGCCIVNRWEKVGYGMPQYQLLDNDDVADFFIEQGDEYYLPTITGNDQGYLVDYDHDGDVDDVLIPFDFDVTGDGKSDWGWLVDKDDDGLPDASPDFPFYPVGSPEFQQIIEQGTSGSPSIIVVTPDGDMSIYDMDGTLKAEDADTAYQVWSSKYGILQKPIADYSVTEGILLIGLIVASFGFVSKIFRRKRVV